MKRRCENIPPGFKLVLQSGQTVQATAVAYSEPTAMPKLPGWAVETEQAFQSEMAVSPSIGASVCGFAGRASSPHSFPVLAT